MGVLASAVVVACFFGFVVWGLWTTRARRRPAPPPDLQRADDAEQQELPTPAEFAEEASAMLWRAQRR